MINQPIIACQLSDAGGRLVIASDGIWDTLSSDAAAKACRGLPADLAAKLVVKEALRSRGLKDDTTCLVVDIIPSVHPVLPPLPQKKHHGLSGLIFGKKSHNLASKSSKLSAVGAVEELFEEGSAMLEERKILQISKGSKEVSRIIKASQTFDC
ncbi:probable protein phosphatase 2C 33 isoform X4 [Beta vulgaris subsp. vulgaris]|uniref:probable protein phosphatase 2C 33 isoform X4 n=1 Tax=Beta vulgaris subsp. vulgaris TaxID=3555 RepID=UPI002547BD5C|nr:probable protein phosphatase 2C 33 isoform X4 [Beta vulgaris subsp. vulgaris]